MNVFRFALLAAPLMLVPIAADAADLAYPTPPPEVVAATPGGWTVVLAPYLWAAGLSGDVGVGGRTAEIDQSFSDILSNLDIGFMGVAEVRYNRFGIFSDLVYGKLSASQDTPLGILANKIGVTTTTLMWTGGAEYRLVDDPGVNLDVLAGFRLYSVGSDLDFDGGLLDGFSVDGNETWADPLVGLKGSVDVSRRLYLTGWAMIGGGVSSDILWDVMAGAGYRFNDTISAVAGYRAAGVDYTNGGFTYDTVQQGPFSGVVFRF